MKLRDRVEEVREVGLRSALFRVKWSAGTRMGLGRYGPSAVPVDPSRRHRLATDLIPLPAGADVARAVRDRIGTEALVALRVQAEAASRGIIECFGKWTGDYGMPIDWYLDPTTGKHHPEGTSWSAAARNTPAGDVKMVWEIARFPHAYVMARAGAFFPSAAESLAGALMVQIGEFRRCAPPTQGIHWSSGQEIAIRSLAWMFALDVLLVPHDRQGSLAVGDGVLDGARHIDNLIEFAQKAVNNNHLISESLGLYCAGILLPSAPEWDPLESTCRHASLSIL